MSKTEMIFDRGDKVKIKESLYPDDVGIIVSASLISITVKWTNGGIGIYTLKNNTIERI